MKENRLYFSYIKDAEVKFKAELNGIYYEYKDIDVKKIQKLFDSADDFMSLCLYKELTYLLKAGIRPKDQPGYDMMAQMRMYLKAVDENIDSDITNRHQYMKDFCEYFNLEAENYFELLEVINNFTLETINRFYTTKKNSYRREYIYESYESMKQPALNKVAKKCLSETGRVPYQREINAVTFDYEYISRYHESDEFIPNGTCAKTPWSWQWCSPFCNIYL